MPRHVIQKSDTKLRVRFYAQQEEDKGDAESRKRSECPEYGCDRMVDADADVVSVDDEESSSRLDLESVTSAVNEKVTAAQGGVDVSSDFEGFLKYLDSLTNLPPLLTWHPFLTLTASPMHTP